MKAALFFYFPIHAPMFCEPGSRGFCQHFNKDGGSTCRADSHRDEEFPYADMCIGKTGIIRVHGCMWCGDCDQPPHATPDCPRRDITYPDDEIQMTMEQWNKSGRNMPSVRSASEARKKDKLVLHDMQKVRRSSASGST